MAVIFNLGDGTTALTNFEGGNIDLRVPYIGYASESIDYKAAGVAAYNALQAHIEKRMSHGIQVGLSYTYSHALDEQSALGLFYNGNNPLNLRDGYASSDFDRTHVVNFNYVYRLPDFYGKYTLAGPLHRRVVAGRLDCAAKRPTVTASSTTPAPSAACTTVSMTASRIPSSLSTTPLALPRKRDRPFRCLRHQLQLQPSTQHASILRSSPLPVLSFLRSLRETHSRQISPPVSATSSARRSQKRADISLVKMTNFNERYSLKYTFDVYNLTNTASLDIPGNEVSQNQYYNYVPSVGQTVSPTGCDADGNQTNESFYNCPSGLGFRDPYHRQPTADPDVAAVDLLMGSRLSKSRMTSSSSGSLFCPGILPSC